MKKIFSTWALIPCALFLGAAQPSVSQVAEIYKRIVFEKGAGWISKEELTLIAARSLQDPEALFKLEPDGAAEREPIRQGLKQLRILAGKNVKEIVPLILVQFSRRLKLLESEDVMVRETIAQTAQVEFPITKMPGFKFFSVDDRDVETDRIILIRQPMTIVVWSLKEKRELVSFNALRASSARLIGNGTHVLIERLGGGGTHLAVYNLSTRKWLKLPDDVKFSSYFTVSPNGQHLLTCRDRYSEYWIWSLKSNRAVATGANLYSADSRVRAAMGAWFLPDSTVMTDSEKRLSHWDPNSGVQTKIKRKPGFIPPSVVSADGKFWIVQHRKDHAQVWDATTLKPLPGTFRFSPERAADTSFSRDGSLIIIPDEKKLGVLSKRIVIWDVAHRKPKKTVGPSTSGERYGTGTLSNDNRFLATIQTSGQVSNTGIDLWDLSTGIQIVRIEPSEYEFVDIHFSSDSKFMVANASRRDDASDYVFTWDLEKIVDETQRSK